LRQGKQVWQEQQEQQEQKMRGFRWGRLACIRFYSKSVEKYERLEASSALIELRLLIKPSLTPTPHNTTLPSLFTTL
jgi:hypothetical protein